MDLNELMLKYGIDQWERNWIDDNNQCPANFEQPFRKLKIYYICA